MCFCKEQSKRKVHCVYSSNGEVDSQELVEFHVPEHIDYHGLNRDLKTGILSFRYENQNEQIVVYSSPEAKTFCILMGITPLRCKVFSYFRF